MQVEIISDRKIIDTTPSPFRGGPVRIEVDVCRRCSAIVFDPIAHNNWHREVEGE